MTTALIKGVVDQTIWVEILKETANAFKFHVINGNWTGWYYRDTQYLTVESDMNDGICYKGNLVWEGKVPREFANDYNTAIRWIEEQLKEKFFNFPNF